MRRLKRTTIGTIFEACVALVMALALVVAFLVATGRADPKRAPACLPFGLHVRIEAARLHGSDWSLCSFRWNGSDIRVLAGRTDEGATFKAFGEPDVSKRPSHTLKASAAIAGTNGDFVKPACHGTAHRWVRDGVVKTEGCQGPYVYNETDGYAWIGYVADGPQQQFGGEPLVVQDGKNVGLATCPVGGPCHQSCGKYHCDAPIYDLNPRTAIGVSEDGYTTYLVTVDGRQRGQRGLKFPGEGMLMRHLGSYFALNLDGGGSTVMWARARGIVDSPCYTERTVRQAIGLVP